eukprot:3106299-Pleurochrysis_carterae.AAC.1
MASALPPPLARRGRAASKWKRPSTQLFPVGVCTEGCLVVFVCVRARSCAYVRMRGRRVELHKHNALSIWACARACAPARQGWRTRPRRKYRPCR